jgi:hypothetical protein
LKVKPEFHSCFAITRTSNFQALQSQILMESDSSPRFVFYDKDSNRHALVLCAVPVCAWRIATQ